MTYHECKMKVNALLAWAYADNVENLDHARYLWWVTKVAELEHLGLEEPAPMFAIWEPELRQKLVEMANRTCDSLGRKPVGGLATFWAAKGVSVGGSNATATGTWTKPKLP